MNLKVLVISFGLVLASFASYQAAGSAVGPSVEISQPARGQAGSGVGRTNPIDSVLSGGVAVSLPSTMVQFDLCTVDDTQKGCARYCEANPSACAATGGGAGGGSAQYSMFGRCQPAINSPTGTTLKTTPSGYSSGRCDDTGIVWNKATGGELQVLYEIANKEQIISGSYYVMWENSSISEWDVTWTGLCSGVKSWRCWGTRWYASIGGEVKNEEVTATAVNKTTGETHTVHFVARLQVCGAIVGASRYGCA